MIKRSFLTFVKAWVGCPVSNNIWLKTELDQAIPLHIQPLLQLQVKIQPALMLSSCLGVFISCKQLFKEHMHLKKNSHTE